ncbi:putative atp-dependent rna helicase mak5 [Phaeomoniella chlamydospora]|uniref:Putative atp-dependent rna helicase mak5 n=1 Tax=Phaeomoniella chlamydospora TaxID=158046 RepID=A0A0G2ENG0_PHACM|nr:putative atp-dependent rna helicase mak5 [Phaeomoniella chlamydospora]
MIVRKVAIDSGVAHKRQRFIPNGRGGTYREEMERGPRSTLLQLIAQECLASEESETAGVTRLIAKVHSSSSESDGKSGRSSLVPVEIDRQLINRLSPRVKLSQKITDAILAKEKAATRDDWIHKAAEELGVDYDSDEFVT